MTRISPSVDRLVDALQFLPGVGPKSATRMALLMLKGERAGAERLAKCIQEAVELVHACSVCRNLSETEVCAICSSPKRDPKLLCIVESVSDVIAIESSGQFSGRYFVLHGRLSPIDGIGPSDLGLDRLPPLVAERGIKEVILATNPTIEGEATAQFISESLEGQATAVTRIAHGVPIGGELDYVDGGTIAHAIRGRVRVGS